MGSLGESMDFALRVTESAAFAMHGVLGVTDPCHGAVRNMLQAEGSLPQWFWPAAGIMLWLVAAANFSGSPEAVLAAQAFVAAFHSGGAFFHIRLNHHPAAPFAPGFFVIFAAAVAALRLAVWPALLGTLVCAATGAGLGFVLVKPPSSSGYERL